MRKLIVGLTALVVLLYIAAIYTPYDPDERTPGTRLSGSLAANQSPDWSFLGGGRTKVWVETRTLYLIPHSITAMAWTEGGELYVGCRSCDGKYWSRNVRGDNYVRIKIGDEIYLRRALRLDDAQRRAILWVPESESLPDRAVFRMAAY